MMATAKTDVAKLTKSTNKLNDNRACTPFYEQISTVFNAMRVLLQIGALFALIELLIRYVHWYTACQGSIILDISNRFFMHWPDNVDANFKFVNIGHS